MKTLEITRDRALKAYKSANIDGKNLLIELLGKEPFDENLINRIKTFEDVLDETGEDAADYEIEDSATPALKAITYMKRLKLIAKVFNGDWKANLADTGQSKYYPWFYIKPDTSKPSGFGLSCLGYVCDSSAAILGVRPYFKDSNTAVYVGKQFIAEFEGYAQNLNLSE